MKLLVGTRLPRPRVVFAEASKDAVDFLFSLLSLPAGTAVRLLGKESMAGSVGNLYSSGSRQLLRPARQGRLLCPWRQAPPLPAPPHRTEDLLHVRHQPIQLPSLQRCRTRGASPACVRDGDPVKMRGGRTGCRASAQRQRITSRRGVR
ncbi:hypothetical protein ZWY2020_027987 [Hordeum vulgare]|nr:hypothetical protein ZWY2020_027987 [Hordeum vulgare]